MNNVTSPGEQARFLQRYAKRYHAGAFATPSAKEIGYLDVAESDGSVVVSRWLTRDSVRKDFTGRKFMIRAGTRIATHVAHEPGKVPGLEGYDHVFAYAEDHEMTGALTGGGFSRAALRVSAAAELIGCWERGPGYPYAGHDLATVTQTGTLEPETLARMRDEISGAAGWDDDFPYYSDGSWSSLSLKGFWPDDPARGVKPAEMPKTWKLEHPADLARAAEWTVLAASMPVLAGWVRARWPATERVRLLQMSGRGGKGGALKRHSDITDHDSGTGDGQITRFHIPLVTDPRIELHTWNADGVHQATHLAEGGVYYLDARKPHAVTNPTGIDRIHLVADVVTDASVRETISAAYTCGQAA